MILPLIDQKIRRAFSNSAVHYEVLASLQREIGRDLVKKIIDHEPADSFLDIGMGTGYLTNKLRTMFNESRVVGMDFASGMVEQALKKYEDLSVTQAQARELPFKSSVFDVVTSNLAFQWVPCLSDAFGEVHRVLQRDGVFIATMFGHETLKELFEAIQLSSNGREFQIQRLPKLSDIRADLERSGFYGADVSSEIISTHFEDMLTLVRWLKKIGANAVPRDFYVGRDWLFKTNELYNEKFKERLGVKATFEVIWITAKKS